MARASLLMLLLSAGCHLVFPFASSGASVAGDSTPGAPRDGRFDALLRPEAGPLPDATLPALSAICPLQADEPTVALFDFVVADDGTFANRVAPGNAGSVVGDVPATALAGCPGGGLRFAEPSYKQERCADCSTATTFYDCLAGGYALIPSWPVVESLATGAIDFWFRIDDSASADKQFLLSRDAEGTRTSGHLSVWREGAMLGVRLQEKDSQGSTAPCVCSDPAKSPIADGAWHHVGLNFGAAGLELFVDGRRQPATGHVSSICTCIDGAAITNGIDGNQQPFVVGAAAINACEGTHEPLTLPARAAVANLRISRVRRRFAELPLRPPLAPNAGPCCAGDGNTCATPPGTVGCDMTMPGGYCDPNGDASYTDADWNRGWYECH